MSKETIERVIATLKQLDVRGFDSMDKLVGLVMLFNSVLAEMREAEIRAVEMQENNDGTD